MMTPPPRGWRRFVLPASLLLNLFLVALIGGHFLRGEARPARLDGSQLARALANAKAVLSPEDAAAFGGVFKRDAPNFAESARRLEETRATLERTITAEPFDKAAVQQALNDWQDAWNRFLGQAGGSVVEALDSVSPEGRRKLVAQRRQAAGADR